MRLSFNQEWEIGDPLDRGGFGFVRLANSGEVQAVAKFVPKVPGAEREMLFVELGSARNVIPIIDSGETEDSSVMIMPRAERSLRAHIDAEGPALSADGVRSILIDVATALVDIDGIVVHRDISQKTSSARSAQRVRRPLGGLARRRGGREVAPPQPDAGGSDGGQLAFKLTLNPSTAHKPKGSGSTHARGRHCGAYRYQLISLPVWLAAARPANGRW